MSEVATTTGLTVPEFPWAKHLWEWEFVEKGGVRDRIRRTFTLTLRFLSSEAYIDFTSRWEMIGETRICGHRCMIQHYTIETAGPIETFITVQGTIVPETEPDAKKSQ